jgi:hypothetical protein
MQLTDTPSLNEGRPTGSTDDSSIAYEIIGTGTIYVSNSDGSNPVALPKAKNEFQQRYPSFKR